MPFQLNAKNVFLTYPQCPISKEACLFYLLEAHSIEAARVGLELHQDGNTHLHVYLRGVDSFRTKNERLFDLHGFHANIQSCRRINDVVRYCGKSGNYIDYGDIDAAPEKRTWHDLLLAPNALEAKALARENFPRDYVLNHEKICYFLDQHFAPVVSEYAANPDHIFLPTEQMTTWCDQRLSEGN